MTSQAPNRIDGEPAPTPHEAPTAERIPSPPHPPRAIPPPPIHNPLLTTPPPQLRCVVPPTQPHKSHNPQHTKTDECDDVVRRLIYRHVPSPEVRRRTRAPPACVSGGHASSATCTRTRRLRMRHLAARCGLARAVCGTPPPIAPREWSDKIPSPPPRIAVPRASPCLGGAHASASMGEGAHSSATRTRTCRAWGRRHPHGTCGPS